MYFPVYPNISEHPELARCSDAMNIAVITALSTYAGEATEMGYRAVAVEHLAAAVAIVESMERFGRGDTGGELIRMSQFLDQEGPDGIRQEVFARAREITTRQLELTGGEQGPRHDGYVVIRPNAD